MNFDYDLLVIGGGPGGYTAAIRGAQLGLKTALAEKDRLGGTCLNRGCIPTKTIIAASESFAALKKGEAYGISASELSLDFSKTIKFKEAAITRLRNGVNFLLRKNGVQVLRGEAAFLDEHTVEIKGKKVTAAQFILATGSQPRPLPCPCDSTQVVNSDGLLELKALPEHLLIIGGGIIGLEFAGAFLNLGCRVTIVEMLDTITGPMETEIAQELEKSLKAQGLALYTGHRVERITGDAPVKVFCRNGVREECTLEADLVLNSVGRMPYLEGLALEKAGVEGGKQGIIADEHFRTNQKHIFAIGDVLGGIQLAHLASAQGICAAEILAGQQPSVDLEVLPQCLYTSPQAAWVGLNAREAEARGIPFQEAVFPLSASGKALAMGAEAGLVKLIFDEDKRLLGVHMLAPQATEIIGEAALLLSQKLGLSDLSRVIHAHPTISETLMEAALLGESKPIHTLKR